MTTIQTEPLTAAAFAGFGDVIEAAGPPDRMINAGLCARFHDRARIEVLDGRAGLSVFDAKAFTLPYGFDLVERHPLGSQAFVPMTQAAFLVIVAPGGCGIPGTPRAFLSSGTQAINLHRGIWHGVLTPLQAPGRFVVLDRIGTGANLEEYRYAHPWTVIGA